MLRMHSATDIHNTVVKCSKQTQKCIETTLLWLVMKICKTARLLLSEYIGSKNHRIGEEIGLGITE